MRPGLAELADGDLAFVGAASVPEGVIGSRREYSNQNVGRGLRVGYSFVNGRLDGSPAAREIFKGHYEAFLA